MRHLKTNNLQPTLQNIIQQITLNDSIHRDSALMDTGVGSPMAVEL
jgi:hypothetical protein